MLAVEPTWNPVLAGSIPRNFAHLLWQTASDSKDEEIKVQEMLDKESCAKARKNSEKDQKDPKDQEDHKEGGWSCKETSDPLELRMQGLLI